MDFDQMSARRYNKLLCILIVVQILVLLVIASLLIWPVMGVSVSSLTVMSAAGMLIICLPLLLFLCLTGTNRELKLLFLALFISIFLLSVSGIISYTLPQVLGDPEMIAAGQVFTLTIYGPTLLVLIYLWNARKNRPGPNAGALVILINALAAMVIVLFVAMNYYTRPVDALHIAIYTMSIILDIAVLSLASALAISYMENQSRYVLSLFLVFFLISLVGDSMSLLTYMGLYDFAGLTQMVYDSMVIFAALALLVYSLSNIKVTTVEEMSRKLLDTRHLMSDLIMQMPEAICIFDTGGDAVLANNAFLLVTGEKPEGVIGKLNIFRDADRLADSQAAGIAGIRGGEKTLFEGARVIRSGDGASRHYRVNAFPAFGSEGIITSYIVIMTDVTDYKNYEEELVRARGQAELYLDLMGHDINNMNQIGIGFLEMALSRTDLDNDGQMLLRKPLEAMQNSSHLIDNVKKIQRASTGASDRGPVDLGKILEEVVSDYSIAPGRDVIIEYIPVHGCYVMASPLLREIFSNLIGNAFKHSDGPLKVWIKVTPQIIQGGTGYYHVFVEDNGPGIPDNIKQILKDPISPLHSRTGGGGLGLYLVRTLVESFKGTITVEDRVPLERKSGTRIVVTLPATDIGGNPCTIFPSAPDDIPAALQQVKIKDLK
jgi:PAS domain S-box-containing protein